MTNNSSPWIWVINQNKLAFNDRVESLKPGDMFICNNVFGDVSYSFFPYVLCHYEGSDIFRQVWVNDYVEVFDSKALADFPNAEINKCNGMFIKTLSEDFCSILLVHKIPGSFCGTYTDILYELVNLGYLVKDACKEKNLITNPETLQALKDAEQGINVEPLDFEDLNVERFDTADELNGSLGIGEGNMFNSKNRSLIHWLRGYVSAAEFRLNKEVNKSYLEGYKQALKDIDGMLVDLLPENETEGEQDD